MLYFRKVTALILILMLTFDTGISFAINFEQVNTVYNGMTQVPLSEQKINNVSTYLFQNRNPLSTSTLFESTTNQFIELDAKKISTYNLWSSGSDSYNFTYGKSLYDANIAILDLPTTSSGRYTYEAPYYCDLLISSLWKYAKIGNNICLPNYEEFNTAFTANPDRTYVSVIKTNEIHTADLSHFGILIFPDIILSKHADILESFWSWGIDKIKTFVKNWGIVYFSSKSLILADKMELTNHIVDENLLIKHHENQGKITLSTKTDFVSQVLNTGLYEGKTYSAKTGSGYYDYLLGSYFLHVSSDPGIVPVRYFDTEHDANYYFQDLTTLENAELDVNNAVSAFYKPYEKWLVIYNGWNSLFSSQTTPQKLFINHTLNSILLSFMRELFVSAKVTQKSNPELKENLVPSLERNIILEYSLDTKNVYNESSTSLQATIDIATGGLLIEGNIPDECSISHWSGQILCTKDSLSAGNTWTIKFGLKVNEPNFTKAGTNIVVTKTHLTYIDSKWIPVDQNLSNQTVDAVESANIRASLNIDPSAYYPLKGEWVYIDQVLNVSNNWPTEANQIRYSVSVPLISPLVDEVDQNMLISKLVFAKDYHNALVNIQTKTNVYPMQNIEDCTVSSIFSSDRCKDYLIPKLYPSGAILVDNYDEPVYREKTDIDDAWTNISHGELDPDLWSGIEKQTFLPDADKLLMHAGPRRMAYTHPIKKELLFARQDVYFYNNPAFPLPNGITGWNQFISIDKDTDCDKIPGSYGYPNGIIAGKYPNTLLCNGSGSIKKWVHDKISWDNLPVWMEKTTYLYPISPENGIDSAEMLEWFNGSGMYLGQKDDQGNISESYPIQYIRGSYGTFYLPPRSTPKGGYIEFTLPEGITASKAYILADHIAVTKTEIIGQTVRAYFYRGKLPNEQYLKSIIGIGLTGINNDLTNIPIKIYSLKYDLSGDPINKYDLENTISINFTKYSFLELPAVKMTFELPRRKRINEKDIKSLWLTQGQINVIFTRPDYYNGSLVFVKNSLPDITALLNKTGLNPGQKDAILAIFTVTPTESYLRRWEKTEPFVRFGTYIQELAHHRTVWGTAEDHPISDPGIMADRTMFGHIGNIGTSPIPFQEYLTTGKAQIIPMATENARIDYIDIFGRVSAAPIRSTIPEAVPLPPPLRNFMINTTYEMYDKTGKRYYEWDGQTELEIRQNIKLSNNYSKFFDPTICGDNPNGIHYGACYDGTGSVTIGYSWDTEYRLGGHTMNDVDFYWTHFLDLFSSKSAFDTFIVNLREQMNGSGSTVWSGYILQTLSRAVDGKWEVRLSGSEKINDRAHNYSPEVESYYPKNYLDNSMWNLTHYDYDDTVFSKGYPYHAVVDNMLPNPSNDLILPHNILAIPMSRGTSYKMKYFSEEPYYLKVETDNYGKIEHNLTPYASWKFFGRSGWWGENLQNRDKTLLAGQESSNTIPYAWTNDEYVKPSLVSLTDFTKRGTNNIYSCLFNPYKLNEKAGKYSYAPNVVMNNIIPMIPWIQKENTNTNYLSSYSCSSSPYTESRLPKVNNIVETENAYWLYFASNLRAEAKEWLNIVSHLLPFSTGSKYEGDVKVVEGGRFTYWNPVNGPNSFLVVDGASSLIKTVNSDITLDKELLPYTLKNYKTDAYLLYTIKDPDEIITDSKGHETPRKWKDETYTDSRGDGNYSASIYVGSTFNGVAMKSLLRAGDKTLVQVDLYNNSGYDWAMLGSGTVINDNGQFKTQISGGIDFVVNGENQSLNGNDLLYKLTRNVLKPTAYNFIALDIPEELKPYVHIAPSSANIRTPGTFFDFDFVNATTIRDGFKWSYFLDLSVDENIPEALRAKAYSIGLSIRPDYFNQLPGVTEKDPVNWPVVPHLPDLKFAIADGSGSAYYRSGYSSGITLDIAYNSGFTLDTIQEIDENGLLALRLAAGDGTSKHKRLRETFESLNSSGYSLRSFTPTISLSGSDSVASIDLDTGGIHEFPYINQEGSIVAKTYFLVHLKQDALVEWENKVETSSTVRYANYGGKEQQKTNSTPLNGYVQWPKLDITYKSALIGNKKGDTLEIQKLIEWENTIEVKLFLKNIGTDIAFNPTLKVHVAPGVVIDTKLTEHASINGNEITISNLYNESWSLSAGTTSVWPGITNYFPIYLSYSGTFQDAPLTLVMDAWYEFTPYDPILPALSGSYSTGYALDFMRSSFNFEKTGIDNTTLSLSGNTVGIYWDARIDSQNIATKETNTGSELLIKNEAIDPTKDHALVATSYFRTKTGDFKKIQDFTLPVAKEDPYVIMNTATTNGNTINLSLATNKLWKYQGTYSISASQWEVNTGATMIPNTGTITGTIQDIDPTIDTNIVVSIFDSETNFLTSTTFTVIGVPLAISEWKALRNKDNIRVLFKSNKTKNICYRIERDGTLITPLCLAPNTGIVNFLDSNTDAMIDHDYRISLYKAGTTDILLSSSIFYYSGPDTSSIPLKIIDIPKIGEDITFQKVKDFSWIYMVDNTPVQYVVRIRTNNQENLMQSSDDGKVDVNYGSGQTIYAWENWSKILRNPTVNTGSTTILPGYTITKEIELGDPIVPFILSNYSTITLKEVWIKPDRVTAIHNGVMSEIGNCETKSAIYECWEYDVNHINIYTKKFSKYLLSMRDPIAISGPGWWGSGLRMDSCPNGDYSTNFYDEKCGSPIVGTGTTLSMINTLSGITVVTVTASGKTNISQFIKPKVIINSLQNIKTRDISTSWAKDYIYHLIFRGIVDNTEKYNPEISLTRAEFLKITIKAAGLIIGNQTTTVFTDIASNSWYAPYVAYATSHGIVSDQNSSFRPNDPITRAEIAKIIIGIFGATIEDTKTSFSDVDDSSDLAKYIETTKSLGLLSGQMKDGKRIFRPNDSITRAEIAKAIVKAFWL